MPKRVLQAFVAAEDQRFFSHPGVDDRRRPRGDPVANPRPKLEGACITQQVAKNFLLTNQGTLAQDREASCLPHQEHSKERSSSFSLNEIYLGSGNYGVAAARLNYFDRSLGELNL